MDEQELDLSQINQIDMECDVPLDDDDGFGGFHVDEQPKVSRPVFNQPEGAEVAEPMLKPQGEADDGREIERKTGIILNFGDDDAEIEFNPADLNSEEIVELPPLKAQMTDDGISFREPEEEDFFNGNFKGYNAIDMECSIGEDDDFDIPAEKQENPLMDEEDELLKKELVDEEVINESKRKADAQLDQGVVEDDYYDKLKKKHAKTNVKGAHNVHFHFAGDPEQEVQDFNHDNTPVGPIPNMVTATAEASAEASGMAEAVNPNNYRKLFENLLMITGFELEDCGNGKCLLKDKFNDNSTMECSTINDVEAFLAPYIEDCFIIPLQVETGQELNTCKDWVNWYTPEMQKTYPQFEQDIKYCDLCANHLPECKLF